MVWLRVWFWDCLVDEDWVRWLRAGLGMVITVVEQMDLVGLVLRFWFGVAGLGE
jgi:hypothetical protein